LEGSTHSYDWHAPLLSQLAAQAEQPASDSDSVSEYIGIDSAAPETTSPGGM
jgi:hypothetical protein